MIDPRDRRFDTLRCLGGRRRRTAQHDDRDTEGPRRGDLSVCRLATTVLGNDHVDLVLLKQRTVFRFREWTACGDVHGNRNVERRVDGIDTPYQIEMLRRAAEGRNVVPAERQENARRCITQRRDGVGDCFCVDPVVARPPLPWRTPDRQKRNTQGARRLRRIGGDLIRKGMGGVDQKIDVLVAQCTSQAFRTTETANACRHTLIARAGRPPRERKDDIEIAAFRQDSGQRPGFRRTAKDEDLHGAP